jgi:hypothetical protein
MLWVRFETTIFERAKTIHALDRTATVIGLFRKIVSVNCWDLVKIVRVDFRESRHVIWTKSFHRSGASGMRIHIDRNSSNDVFIFIGHQNAQIHQIWRYIFFSFHDHNIFSHIQGMCESNKCSYKNGIARRYKEINKILVAEIVL